MFVGGPDELLALAARLHALPLPAQQPPPLQQQHVVSQASDLSSDLSSDVGMNVYDWYDTPCASQARGRTMLRPTLQDRLRRRSRAPKRDREPQTIAAGTQTALEDAAPEVQALLHAIRQRDDELTRLRREMVQMVGTVGSQLALLESKMTSHGI